MSVGQSCGAPHVRRRGGQHAGRPSIVDRVLFERGKHGWRSVRGEVIRRLQVALRNAGSDPGEIDGIFGGDIEAALRHWQAAAGVAPTGTVTTACWQALFGKAAPSLRDRCLQLTADFEGHDFGKAAGNFDGAWLTWGIIGFTWRGGALPRLLNEVRASHPALLRRAFGALAGELHRVLDAPRTAQEEWACGLCVGAGRYRLRPDWEQGFLALGALPEVQEVQLAAVEPYWARAKRDADAFGLASELGLALCFDIAVQNGGISEAEARRANRLFDRTPKAGERDVRLAIADAVADASAAKWVEDVRRRKRVFALGEGTVHAARYATRGWGLDEVPAVADRLADRPHVA
jgi:Putative peptidoglycan binding domain